MMRPACHFTTLAPEQTRPPSRMAQLVVAVATAKVKPGCVYYFVAERNHAINIKVGSRADHVQATNATIKPITAINSAAITTPPPSWPPGARRDGRTRPPR
jgi:hypothetical protein